MNKSDCIRKQYEELQKKHKNELDYRKSNLFDKVPRLQEIERGLVKLIIEVSRSILDKTKDYDVLLNQLQHKQMDLKIERAEILTSLNLPIDYLETNYQCKSCKDTGFINGKKCKCYIKKEIEFLYKSSNTNERLKIENFDQFRLDYYSDEKLDGNISPKENMKEIYMDCLKYVKDFDSHNTSLLFIGNPGLGKTFLCNSIAKDLLDAGKSVIYQTSADLIDTIRKNKFNFDKQEENSDYLNELFNCDLLIIDDLGTELTTQFSELVIYNILNKRLLDKKKIIISTNLDIDELMSLYSNRITSRLFGNFNTHWFIGQDIRLKMHKLL